MTEQQSDPPENGVLHRLPLWAALDETARYNYGIPASAALGWAAMGWGTLQVMSALGIQEISLLNGAIMLTLSIALVYHASIYET